MRKCYASAWGARRYLAQISNSNLVSIGHKWNEKVLKGVPQLIRDGCKKDKYILCMFPYPSGVLHIGHLRVYTISDALNRFYQLKGYNVLHPMGWDAFGLPAENAAIERGVNPAVWTKQNIVKMKEQMNLMASNFNWEREVTTCDPDYYKFTQKLFLELFKNGYAYRKEAEINWDPIDQTVLANEQVDSEGKSWRSGALVEKRLLSQWFLGITKFAHELQHDLDNLDQWPEHVKRMQRNWIGESNGVEVVFNVNSGEEIKVFTTRAETLYSVQFVTLALDHPIVKDLKLADKDLQSFINHSQKLPEGSKEGYMVPNLFCQHPLDTAKKIPVFVAPYVLGNYGHGAVMGCPAHDERDFDFWKQNCPEEPVIYTVTNPEETKMDYVQPFISKNGVMNENAKEFCGMSTHEARDAVADKLKNLGFGKSCVQFKLRDWLISRQRYWGAPIPIIHCESCGPVAVPDEDLPVKLPELNVLTKTGNPLAKSAEFVNVKCPSCGAPSKRETDTMDTFMDSSWYFFRFTDPQNKDLPFSYDKASKFMPIDLYIGGVEHAILHLLYSRFISKFTASIGMWDGEHSTGEPIKRLVTQGMVHGKTFVDSQTGRFLKPEEIDHSNSSTPKNASTGQPLIISHEKMSKSKHNGADPSACILKHGVDATRAHILFQAPVSDVLNWDESKIVGIERWLEKMLKYCSSLCSDKDIRLSSTTCFDMNQQEIKLHNGVQELLSSITMSLEKTLSLNTVISDYMKLSNLIEDSIKSPKIRKEFSLLNLQKLTTVLYPVVPCISEELASILKERGYDWDQYRWPLIENIQKSKLVKYQVIINGKKRLIYEEAEEFVQDTNKVIETLKSLPEAGKYLNDVEIKKIITKSNIISLVVA